MHSRISPVLLASTALMAIITAGGAPARAQNLNTYGMPGAIDTPSAFAPPEGQISATLSYSDLGRRMNVSFQPFDRVTATLRYASIKGIDPNRDALKDRSFDLQIRLLDEAGGWQPAVALGLRDFMGTGVYSGEYLVASKTLAPNLRASAGVGWGRLAGAWRRTDYLDQGGKPNVEDWFSGPARPFASIEWQATDRLTLLAEYSFDDYQPEVEGGADAPGGKLNLGADYRVGDSYRIGAYTIGGKTFGIRGSVALNVKNPPFPSGLEPAPAPVRPRPAPGADPEGWSGRWTGDPTAQPAIQTALAQALENEGLELQSLSLSATRAEVRIDNRRYLAQAEAIGRTARLMTRALPPSVETFVITSVENGMPTSSVVLRRADVERLENTAAARIAQVAEIVDAPPDAPGLVATPGLYPKFTWHLRPYAEVSLFDPDDPLRYEVGAEARARYEIVPGLILTGSLRQRAFGTTEQEAPGRTGLTAAEYDALGTDVNEFGIPRVRSDAQMYSGNKNPVIPDLTLAWYAKPTDQIYTRLTIGLLEHAYGGISGEVLWKPVDSRLALGVEINRVRKRDFDQLFSFRDYEVTTGHVSAYYDFGSGLTGQLDVGRYLAGDKGATVTLTREFDNGWRIGGYATVTDMSEEEFGEGSFDKGITLSIPVSWATGRPSVARSESTIRSLSRDGGARVDVSGRLYGVVRDSHSGGLYDGWGRFWR
ncbi:MAG: YjbH domain-containing protein [Paracoccus sp. (in: a-proteobacteria)]|nr:YjbH domain-containing protein [Paracoccus sp. (in: a-proteobacteria)]